MKSIGSFEAKTKLSSLLDRVGRGESFLITKRGRPVASLTPIASSKSMGPKDLIRSFRKEFARSVGKFSQAEIAELKAHGRR